MDFRVHPEAYITLLPFRVVAVVDAVAVAVVVVAAVVGGGDGRGGDESYVSMCGFQISPRSLRNC